VAPVPEAEYKRLQKLLLGGAEPDMETPYRFFVADIDNDGRPEVIGEVTMGSGGYLGLGIYREKGGKLIERDPQFDLVEGAQASQDLLVRICGRTYVSLWGGAQGAMEGYLWKDGKTVRACDPDWTAYQRARFKDSYDRKLFDIANTTLSSHLDTCGDKLPPETRLAILSDMAVTSFHLGDYRSCLRTVKVARAVPGFGRSRSMKALVFNEDQCAHPPAEKQPNDFHWLLDGKKRSAAEDKQLDEALLAATVPDAEPETIALWPLGGKGQEQSRRDAVPARRSAIGKLESSPHVQVELRGLVRDQLTVSDDVKLPVVRNRYVTRAGWLPHSAESRAMLWIDVTAGTSVFVVNAFHDCFLAGSRTLGAGDLSPEFKAAFARWRKVQPLEHKCAYFVDGRKPVLELSPLDLAP
jgi:hypothetical protein